MVLCCGGWGTLQLKLHPLRAGRSHCLATCFIEFQCQNLLVVPVDPGINCVCSFQGHTKLTAAPGSTEIHGVPVIGCGLVQTTNSCPGRMRGKGKGEGKTENGNKASSLIMLFVFKMQFVLLKEFLVFTLREEK